MPVNAPDVCIRALSRISGHIALHPRAYRPASPGISSCSPGQSALHPGLRGLVAPGNFLCSPGLRDGHTESPDKCQLSRRFFRLTHCRSILFHTENSSGRGGASAGMGCPP